MKWVRSNTGSLSRVALFALLVQFALSFGHFHGVANQTASSSLFGSIPSGLSLVRGLAFQAAPGQPTLKPASDHPSDEHPNDICAVCVVMAMANAAMFAAPPVLSLPQAVEFSYLTTEGEFARLASVRVAFQPRAPPIS